MKISIWHLSFALLVGLNLSSSITRYAYGQQPQPPSGEHGSGVGLAACDNPPCAPLPSGGRSANIATGRLHQIHVPTPEQIERREQEKRYSILFASLEGDEQLAQQSEAAGDTSNAASWRADFARKSGLTPEEAEIVKKIAVQYSQDQISLNAACHDDQLAARHTYGPNAGPGFLGIPSCQQLMNLFPKAMADLVAALGSRSFSRLDGYALHFLDNARVLSTHGQPAHSETQQSPASVKTDGAPK